jgi:antitoxin component YwqK of YwqJK toxin-antitoxin module
VKAIYTVIISFLFSTNAIGQYTMPDDSGFTNKAEAKNEMKDSLKEGKWIEYYDDYGHISSAKYSENYHLTIYKHGKPVGIVRNYYTRPGVDALTAVYPYTDGKLNGLVKKYTQGGLLYSWTPYINGEKDGISIEYYVHVQCDYKNDYEHLESIRYETPYTDDKINGVAKEYNRGGGLKSIKTYKDNTLDGITKEYDNNGRIKSISVYTDGRLNGIKTEYYTNGQLAKEAIFIDGKQNGVAKEYYKDSALKSETPYTYGKLD